MQVLTDLMSHLWMMGRQNRRAPSAVIPALFPTQTPFLTQLGAARPDYSIHGKTALITGASRGIGRAIALALADHGARCLVLVARDGQRLAQVATEVEQRGAKVVLLPLDLTQPVAVNVAIAQAWQQHGPIHLLVNCAGVAHQAPFLQTSLHQVQAELDTNLLGLYTITRLVARRMVVRREGCIINVSSLMGKVAAPTMATYSATKFAILGFTQALRGELAPHRVRVVALLPSLTETDMVRGLSRFRGVQSTPPDRVAAALLRGLGQGQTEILVGWQSQWAVLAQRWMPNLVERLVRWASPKLSAPRPPRPAAIHPQEG
ncbi:3-ketoacyl-ACP reductase [Leptolyngbya sp. BL0902]|uniref:SDR family NAD(P)-dependent oxidoreductase n=1 Tax=Leptolyngbya sp. BL0902 TaxID=1115757 RepID=UPI0019374259|nr:SDR family NAD(P)-dependent oxidoreductase [Leptolyngbya sp. BL0902]QQE67234.1 3-ketoacyl-ACP reductase [Leptolyngbya sp. BL0902]